MDHTSNEMSAEDPKGDDSRLTIDMWYRRSCTDQGVGVSEALKNIWEGMLRWGK